MRDLPASRVIAGVTFSVVLIGTATASWVVGLDLLIPIVLASSPWYLLLWNRFGALAAFAMIILTALGVVAAGLMVTAAMGIPLVTAFCVLTLVVGLMGAWRSAHIIWSDAALARGIVAFSGPAAGALLWIVVVVVSRLLPNGSVYGWVMNGDSANNLRFARADMAIAGIRLGSGENPVPLPAGLMAVSMAAGRGSLWSGQLLEHDLGSFGLLWAGTIALICIVVGAVMSSAVPASRYRARWVVGALGSVLPMTWLVVGYPIEYGFFNVHVAILIVLCSWLVFRMSATRPAVAWSALSLASTLLLTVWSPLVLFPISLMLTIFLRGPRALWRSPAFARVLAIMATAQLLLYAAAVEVPALFVQGGFLAGGGAAYPFSKIVLPALSLAAVVFVIVARRRVGLLPMQGFLAATASLALAYGVLVLAAGSSVDPFNSYYPSKLMWLALVVILVVALGLALGSVANWRLRGATFSAIAVLSVATVVFVQTAPINKMKYPLTNPIEHMFSGDLYGPDDRVARTILQFADPSRPTILWNSGQPEEGQVNFWVLQMQASYGPSGLGLRRAGYGEYDVHNPSDLCQILREIGRPTRVITGDSSLAVALVSKCPTLHTDVEPISKLP